jgi:hypothetical protein
VQYPAVNVHLIESVPEHQKQQAMVTGLVTAFLWWPQSRCFRSLPESTARARFAFFLAFMFCREFTLPGMPETRANPAMAVLTLDEIMFSVESHWPRGQKNMEATASMYEMATTVKVARAPERSGMKRRPSFRNRVLQRGLRATVRHKPCLC